MKRLFTFTVLVFLFFNFATHVNVSLSTSINSDNCNTIFKKGEGCFDYKIKALNFSIPVYYYLPNEPNQLDPYTKVVFALHGKERNAQDYRNEWQNIYADNKNFILLAPKFDQKHFPGAAGYNLGNMFTEDLNTINPQNQWAFTEIENIFDFVKRSTKVKAVNYYLYGHSAGAQFVHRMLIFLPHSRIKKAVAAEADSYTIPSYHTEYPCGLKKKTGEQLPPLDLRTTFRIPMTIIVGTVDNTHPSDSFGCGVQEQVSDNSSEQSSNEHFIHGEYFFDHAQNIAKNMNEDFQWTLKKVVTQSHEDPMFVSCAALEFFPELKRVISCSVEHL